MLGNNIKGKGARWESQDAIVIYSRYLSAADIGAMHSLELVVCFDNHIYVRERRRSEGSKR